MVRSRAARHPEAAKEPIDGPQRLGRHLRTVDVSLAGDMERRAGHQHDRQRHEIAERHANPGIHTNPFEGGRSLLGRLGELLATWLLALVFGFLGRLPLG
jgi:hypothetical protein